MATTIDVEFNSGQGNRSDVYNTTWWPDPTDASINVSNVSYPLCGEGLKSFRAGLTVIYGVLATIICSLGLLTNLLTIVVLTRKNMYRSATNAILTGIAVADLMFLLCILVFNLINYDVLTADVCLKASYGLKILSLITIRCALTFHSISVVLTLILAIWRYIAVTFPLKIREWCSLYRTCVAIIVSYVAVPIGNIMLYLSRTVDRKDLTMQSSSLTVVVDPTQNVNNCALTYDIVYTSFSGEGNSLFYNVAFWIYGVLFKIVPCIALIVFSAILVRTLYTSSRERSKLTQNSNSSSVDRSCERTTKMLLAILLLFLITELPQGILLTLVAALDTTFYESCYSDLVEVNDLLEILNCSLNFIFYYAMSKQFRRTFLRVFKLTGMSQERNSSKSQESTVTQLETNC